MAESFKLPDGPVKETDLLERLNAKKIAIFKIPSLNALKQVIYSCDLEYETTKQHLALADQLVKYRTPPYYYNPTGIGDPVGKYIVNLSKAIPVIEYDHFCVVKQLDNLTVPEKS